MTDHAVLCCARAQQCQCFNQLETVFLLSEEGGGDAPTQVIWSVSPHSRHRPMLLGARLALQPGATWPSGHGRSPRPPQGRHLPEDGNTMKPSSHSVSPSTARVTRPSAVWATPRYATPAAHVTGDRPKLHGGSPREFPTDLGRASDSGCLSVWHDRCCLHRRRSTHACSCMRTTGTQSSARNSLLFRRQLET